MIIKFNLFEKKIESKNPKYSNFPDAIKTIYKEEGFRGFFKGARIAVVTVPIFYSMYFPIYEYLKYFFARIIYKKDECNNAVIYTLSSGTAAMLCDLVTNPMWIVRIRKQTEFIHSGCQKMDSFDIWGEIIKLYKKVKIIIF